MKTIRRGRFAPPFLLFDEAFVKKNKKVLLFISKGGRITSVLRENNSLRKDFSQ